MSLSVRGPARRSAPLSNFAWTLALVPVLLAAPAITSAQIPIPGPPPPPTARAGAPQDLTGYWVSLVTEDWRVRMMTPDKGDFVGVPLNAAGRSLLAKWDPAKDEASGEQCKSYGAAAIMRVPTRLHITWADDNDLRVETDAGKQVREFHFGGKPPQGAAPTLQGYSVAAWDGLRPGGQRGVTATLGGPKVTAAGYLKVQTSNLKPGYLRKNGIPYGSATQVEEYFDSFTETNGDVWLVVTTIVTDPEYLDGTFITSSHFKKLPGPTGWRPADCEAR